MFNVNSRLSELILGTPPIEILNNMNVINKHFLKIIMVAKQHPEGNSNNCLLMHIKSLCLSESIPSALYRQLKLSYEFLNWKFKCTPEQFTAADKQIISELEYSSYHLLSAKSCTYAKQMFKQFLEICWQKSITNYFMAEGYHQLPKAVMDPLAFPDGTTRETEVLVISLFYYNNLLNGSLHRLYPTIYKSPLCDCGKGVQDNYHVLLECKAKSKDSNNFIFELKACFAKNNEVRDAGYHTNIQFLNASRDALTLKLMVKRITVLSNTLRKAISL